MPSRVTGVRAGAEVLGTAESVDEVARKEVVVENDIYADLDPEPRPSLAGLDQLSRVVHIGSYSKTIKTLLLAAAILAPAITLAVFGLRAYRAETLLLREHRSVLDAAAKELLEKETLDEDALRGYAERMTAVKALGCP